MNVEGAEIRSALFSVYLEVRFHWSALPSSECYYVSHFYEALCMSLDNTSRIEVKIRHLTPEILFSNGSSVIQVHNSPMEPFPFDLDRNKTLYVWITWKLCDGIRYSSNVVTTRSPISIHRMWYFVIDWTLPAVAFSTFLPLSAVFVVARKARRKQL